MDWVDLFGSESRIQRYMFMADVVACCSSVNLVVHDDACHMAKYCRHVNRFTDKTWSQARLSVHCLASPARVSIVNVFRVGVGLLHAHAKAGGGTPLVAGLLPQQ